MASFVPLLRQIVELVLKALIEALQGVLAGV